MSPAPSLEERLRSAVSRGEALDVRDSDPTRNDPKQGSSWGPERTIHASVLAEILTTDPQTPNAPNWLNLRGARVVGSLDLDNTSVSVPIALQDCYLEETVWLQGAEVRSLRFEHCMFLGELDASRVVVHGDLDLDRSRFEGGVDLQRALVEGTLSCIGTHVEGGEEYSLMLDSATVKGDVFCRNGFSARGEIRMLGACIDGQASFEGATLDNADGDALSMDACSFGEDLYCGPKFSAKGTVRLYGARIEGSFTCTGARLESSTRPALAVDRACVGGRIDLGGGFRARGQVRFAEVEVGSEFLCGGGFDAPGSVALDLTGCSVAGNLVFAERFQANGRLDLRGAELKRDLAFDAGSIVSPELAILADRLSVKQSLGFFSAFSVEGGAVSFAGAEIGGDVHVMGTELRNPTGQALAFDGARIGGDVRCAHGFAFTGITSFADATIGGSLIWRDGRAELAEGKALSAEGATIGGGFMLAGVVVEGTTSLLSAEIGGQLTLRGTTLINREGETLLADRVTVTAGALLSEGFRSEGEVRMMNATIRGQFNGVGATINNPGGIALSLHSCTFESDVFLSRGFRATGGVVLTGASVSGVFSCADGRFSNGSEPALRANNARFEGGVHLTRGFRAEGPVLMRGCRFAFLTCTGGRFEGTKMALALGGSVIETNLACREGFVAEGEVSVNGVEVGGNFNCQGGKFRNPRRRSIVADRLTVAGQVSFIDGFLSEGELRLPACELSGQLLMKGGVLVNPGGTALNLHDAKVRALHLNPGEAVRGRIDLQNAEVGFLLDNDAAWADEYTLQGFRYDRLRGEASKSAEPRLRWLRNSLGGYQPEIYDQLAGYYDRSGRDELQRQVLIAKQRQRRSSLGRASRLWSVSQDALVGFGYRTWQAIVPFVLLAAFGTIFFAARYESGELTERVKDQSPSFKPLTYTLDLLLPVIDLGQRATWIPHHAAQTVSTILVLIGWIMTTAILAVLAAAFARPLERPR